MICKELRLHPVFDCKRLGVPPELLIGPTHDFSLDAHPSRVVAKTVELPIFLVEVVDGFDLVGRERDNFYIC